MGKPPHHETKIATALHGTKGKGGGLFRASSCRKDLSGTVNLVEDGQDFVLKDSSQVAACHLALLNMVINVATQLFCSQGEGLAPVLKLCDPRDEFPNRLLKFLSCLLVVTHEIACITNRLLKVRVHVLNKLLKFFTLSKLCLKCLS